MAGGVQIGGTQTPDPGAAVQPVRVGAGFRAEFPGCTPLAAEAAANVVRLVSDYLAELTRRRRDIAALSASGFEALAILDGAPEPLTGSAIAERLLVTTASITSLIDTLAARGYVTRTQHPSDRRKVLVAITDAGRDVVDRVLPVVYRAAQDAFGGLGDDRLEALIATAIVVRARLAAVASDPPPQPGPRVRPGTA
jgi:DNA-binding MarR family transcriptional regulator